MGSDVTHRFFSSADLGGGMGLILGTQNVNMI